MAYIWYICEFECHLEAIFMIFDLESPSYKYNLPSDFDIGKPGTAMAGNNSKAGVYSFGISREYYKKVYIPQSK